MHIGYIETVTSFGLQHLIASELRKGDTLSILLVNCGKLGSTAAKRRDFKEYSNITGLEWKGKVQIVWSLEDLRDCDFVFCDYNDWWDLPTSSFNYEEIRKVNPRFIGPTGLTDAMEENRALGKFIAKNLGFNIPASGHFFSDRKAAVSHVETLMAANPSVTTGLETEYGVVLKNSVNTVIPLSYRDAINLLKTEGTGYFEPFNSDKKDPINKNWTKGVFIEDRIVGAELAFGNYFNGKTFGSTYVITREHKLANPNGRGGILTAEIGTTFDFWDEKRVPNTIKQAFKMLEPNLKDAEYRGFIDFNFILTAASVIPFFLEFTTRPGYPTEMEVAGYFKYLRDQGLSKTRYIDFLRDLARGTKNSPHKLPPNNNTRTCSMAGALYAHGLGFNNYDRVASGRFQPLLHGKEHLDKPDLPVVVLPFDMEFTSHNEWRMFQWDRSLFLATYNNSVDKCRKILAEYLDKLKMWGHTYSDDIGLEWETTVRRFNEVQAVTPMFELKSFAPITLRKLERGDKAHCSGFMLLLENEQFEKQARFDEARVAGLFKDRNTFAFGAFDGENLIGHAVIEPNYNEGPTKPAWDLTSLAVHPKYAGYGLGSQLLGMALEFILIEKNSRAIRIVEDPEARKFYDKFFDRNPRYVAKYNRTNNCGAPVFYIKRKSVKDIDTVLASKAA